MTADLIRQLRAARAVATPIIAVETAEPAAATRAICGAVNGSAPCKLTWNIVDGLVSVGGEDSAAALLAAAGEAGLAGSAADVGAATGEPVTAFGVCALLPHGSLVIVHNAHRLWEQSPGSVWANMQAVWNLRDRYKETGSTLVLLAPSHRLPSELAQDVTLLREPLPGDDALAVIVREVYSAAEQEAPAETVVRAAKIALRGLNPFAAEQATAEAMTVDGLNLKELWARKRGVIEQTKGATFQTEGLTYESLGGLVAIKDYFTALFSGPCAPEVVVMFDEFEKQMAGSDAQGDNGVGRDMLQVILREMSDMDCAGALHVGHPGTGKSAFTEALAIEHGVPIIKADLNAVKGSLMGESEAGVREFFKMVRGVVGGRPGKALFIGCVNKLTDQIPPELRRRFTRRGIWMFDLPDAQERANIWQIALNRYNLADTPNALLPPSDGWTGADIHNCCEIAHALSITPGDAAQYLVPVSISDPDSIAALRNAANGRWLSSSHSGPYRLPSPVAAAPVRSGRKMDLAAEK
jgi:hypothetical protein